MDHLINFELKMTSIELSEITGKRHDHILRDIRNEIEALGEINAPIFGLVEYTDAKGEKRPCYTFGKKGAMQLALKYDAITRHRVIEKLEELEKRNQPAIPTGTNLLALAILEADRMLREKNVLIEHQQVQLEEQKPKVIFADAVSVSKTSILVGDLAKILKQNGVDTGANRLFTWMRENGYLIRRKGTDYNMPTQKAMNLRLFEIKETVISHSDGHTTTSRTPKVTGDGQLYFINKFLGQEEKLA